MPRLELLKAVLSARLINFVKSALRLSDDVKMICWTDSKVAVSWIKDNPPKWKMFVANSVIEIQTLESPGNWFHCSGVSNPADLLTRGVTGDLLITNDWWLKAPTWVSTSSVNLCTRINDECKTIYADFPTEEFERKEMVSTIAEQTFPAFEFSKWSDILQKS